MFSQEIESFRIRKGLAIKEFCAISRIGVPQYSEYLHKRNHFLMTADAVKLMAAFSNEININTLLQWIDQKPLTLSERFPLLSFSCDLKADHEKSEQVFRTFQVLTAFKTFAERDAIRLLAAMIHPWNRSEIGLPVRDNMYYLMYCLRDVRRIKFTKFGIPAQTVLTHFQRKRQVRRFTDLCEYERAFKSRGIYLLSELIYLNERNGFEIRLLSK